MLTFEKNFAPDQDGKTPFAFAAWRLQMCDLAAELSFDPQNIGSAGTFSEWQLQVKVRLRQGLSAENFYEKYCAAAIDDHSFRAEPSLKLLEKAFK